MTDIDPKALALDLPELVYEALRFANFAAGEGLCAPEDQALARDPDLFLSEYTDRSGDDDWDTLPARIRDALAAFLREAVGPWRPTHRHVKRGSEYRVIGEAEGQVSTGRTPPGFPEDDPARDVADGTKLTVYQGADGKLWWRFPDEFNDGRFEPLPTLAGEG